MENNTIKLKEGFLATVEGTQQCLWFSIKVPLSDSYSGERKYYIFPKDQEYQKEGFYEKICGTLEEATEQHQELRREHIAYLNRRYLQYKKELRKFGVKN